MRLQADGRIAANTQSTKGPVTIKNFNRSNFVLEKLFVMNRRGVHTGPARAAASGDSSIVGLQTRYDTFPLLGAMVRRVAQQRAFETDRCSAGSSRTASPLTRGRASTRKVSPPAETSPKSTSRNDFIDPLPKWSSIPTITLIVFR